jgi:ketosteroid isomerase-like protein
VGIRHRRAVSTPHAAVLPSDTAAIGAQADFQVVCEVWDAFSREDLDHALLRIHEDATAIPFGAAMEGRRYDGHTGVVEWFTQEIQVNWEQFETLPREYRKVGDKLIVYGHWNARGRDSGVELEVAATWVVEVHDGKIAYWQTFTDRDEAHAFAGLRE